MTGGPTTTGTDTAPTTGPLPTSVTGDLPTSSSSATTMLETTSTGTTRADISTTTSTGTTDPGTTSGGAAMTGESGESGESSESSTTGDSSDTDDVCPEGTVLCIDDTLRTCNGNGGFKPDESRSGHDCEFGCLDEFTCKSCALALGEAPCPTGLPRVMVLLDASSSMLNTQNGTQHAPEGMGGWDQVRDALTGHQGLFEMEFEGQPLADKALVGLAVFGHDDPNEARLLVDYGACHEDNFAWALDPQTACEKPGCLDPYAAPPISWTLAKNGAVEDPPGFADDTFNHMPRCLFSANVPKACVGSGTFLHLGLELVRDNLVAHRAACPQAQLKCTDQTPFMNILIVDGKYNSSDAQVQAPLEAMFTAGVTTHVIGFKDAVDKVQLAKLAAWGSGGQLAPHLSTNQDQLETHLAQILATLDFC